ncbi:MAG: DUF1385 domain-containing protein [Patescibacteria group bacterium]
MPIIRGAISMVTMLKLGIQVLTESGEMSGIMDEEPSKFEKWLSRRLGKGVEKIVMGMAALLAVALSVGLVCVAAQHTGQSAACCRLVVVFS